MKLEFYYPLWSLAELPVEKAFENIKQEGCTGVEIALGKKRGEEELLESLKAFGLQLLAQYPFAEGDAFADYKEDYCAKLKYIAALEPKQINCHTGTDYFSFAENCILIEEALKISEYHNILSTHEIHRGRFSFAPGILSCYLEAFPELELTADFSHWCVVTESLLDHHKVAVSAAIERSRHIHARVGNDQSPQVNDPFALEHKEALEAHMAWWNTILEKAAGEKQRPFPITCEFGPVPYLPSLPYSQMPVADI